MTATVETTLTVEAVVDEAIRLAEADPEFVYPEAGCFYARTNPSGAPACLFGQALANLGIPQATLVNCEWKEIGTVLRELDLVSIVHQGTDGPIEALNRAQREQDMLAAWGTTPLEYLRKARKLLP